MSLRDWQKRRETFSAYDGYIWYGVDAENNVAEFQASNTYVPELFFQNAARNKYLMDFFDNLPEITTGRIPENLREEIKPSPDNMPRWAKESNRGLYIFKDPEDLYWYQSIYFEKFKGTNFPYELQSVPERALKFGELQKNVRELLEPCRFENLNFADCQFLDVSEYFYCEE